MAWSGAAVFGFASVLHAARSVGEADFCRRCTSVLSIYVII